MTSGGRSQVFWVNVLCVTTYRGSHTSDSTFEFTVHHLLSYSADFKLSPHQMIP